MQNFLRFLIRFSFLLIALSSFWLWKESAGAPPMVMDSGAYLHDAKLATNALHQEGLGGYFEKAWLQWDSVRPVLTPILASFGLLTLSPDLFDMTMRFNLILLILLFIASFKFSRPHLREPQSLAIAALLSLSPWIFASTHSFMSELLFSLFMVSSLGAFLAPDFLTLRRRYWIFYIFAGLAMGTRPMEGAAIVGVLCLLESTGIFQGTFRIRSLFAWIPFFLFCIFVIAAQFFEIHTNLDRLIYLACFLIALIPIFILQKRLRLPASKGLSAISVFLAVLYLPRAYNLYFWIYSTIFGGMLDPLDLKSKFSRWGLVAEIFKTNGLIFGFLFFAAAVLFWRKQIPESLKSNRLLALVLCLFLFPAAGLLVKNFDQRYYFINFVVFFLLALVLVSTWIEKLRSRILAQISLSILMAGMLGLFALSNWPANVMTSPLLEKIAGTSSLRQMPRPRPSTDFFESLVRIIPDHSRVHVPWLCEDKPSISHDWFNILILDHKKQIRFDSPYPGGDTTPKQIIGKYDYLVHSTEVCPFSPKELIEDINLHCPEGKCEANFWLESFASVDDQSQGVTHHFSIFKVKNTKP